MKISEFYPSNYLTAGDLNGQPRRFIMERLEEVKMRDGTNKPGLYFRGEPKALLLNKTNASNIAAVYGDETAGWWGRELVLFPAIVDFQGRSVDAIRVRAPAVKDRPQPPQTRLPQQTTQQRPTNSQGAPAPRQPPVRDTEEAPWNDSVDDIGDTF